MGGQGISMLVPTLLEMGTEEQKVQFIGPTLRGEMLWCQGYSEPNAGSDLASLATKGELVGEEWVINGQKIWTSTAHLAHWMFCLVRTEPDAAKHEGIWATDMVQLVCVGCVLMPETRGDCISR